MSLTCQAPPDDATVIAYWLGCVVAGCVEVTCWLIVTTNVIDGPAANERIESIVPLPVDTCLSAVRCAATPDVL